MEKTGENLNNERPKQQLPQPREECDLCNIAAAFSVAQGICNTFKEQNLDCSKFVTILNDPNALASDAAKALLEIKEKCTIPEACEMLEELITLAKLDKMEFEEP